MLPAKTGLSLDFLWNLEILICVLLEGKNLDSNDAT
jgi:hypothetical protein